MLGGVVILFHLVLTCLFRKYLPIAYCTSLCWVLAVLSEGFLSNCLGLLTVFLYNFTLMLATVHRLEDSLLFLPLPVTCTDRNPLRVSFPPHPLQSRVYTSRARWAICFSALSSCSVLCFTSVFNRALAPPKPTSITVSPETTLSTEFCTTGCIGQPSWVLHFRCVCRFLLFPKAALQLNH